ncbi:MAG: transcriptional antiterminator, Rof [Proteobacteria bacterium]|nr:MAG: transcriptional antiterminator, Rof [Pseudomonadota bacterium]
MTDYIPIPCSQYDRYEVAIMHRRRLRLTWHVDNVVYRRIVEPIDLQTRDGEEFLIYSKGGKTLSIRLDQIRKVETL